MQKCTSGDICVLSERNGAINAISEKLACACLKMRGNKVVKVADVAMWTNVMAFGAAESIGEYTKMFTLEEKPK